jgi:hypothetical protein
VTRRLVLVLAALAALALGGTFVVARRRGTATTV